MIGNICLVKDYEQGDMIKPVSAGDILNFDNGEFEIHGVLLTPEILEKCGFIHHPEAYPQENWKTLDGFCLYGGHDCYIFRELFMTAMGRIQYLHQLQNLYHALTGTHLTINL